MRTLLRWVVRIAAVLVAAALVIPALHKLRAADAPMPLPTTTWNKPAATVTTRPAALPGKLQPRTVYVPELDVTVPYHDAGQTNGWLDIGSSITEGVHFADGSTLAHGNFLVAAHVNSKDLSLSPFAKLWQVQPGTLVVVTDAAAVPHRFKTVALAYYDKNSLPDDLWRPQGSSTATLVTCGGKLSTADDGSRHYADNVVVRAVPVGTTRT